jgi:hypothetical protein
VGVVGGGERDGPVGAADPGDDRGQGVGEFGADDEEPFGVGLGRGVICSELSGQRILG